MSASKWPIYRPWRQQFVKVAIIAVSPLGSENGPRLSLGNGATFGPKVTYFTVYFLAGSHRSRAAAPDLHESSIVLADPGCPGRDPKVHGKLRHFCHFVPCILDSVANSGGKLPNGARGPTKPQPAAWYFLASETHFDIYIYIDKYIYRYIDRYR